MLEHPNGADQKAWIGGLMARLIIAALLFALPLAAQQPQSLPDAPQPKAEACAPHHLDRRVFWTGISLLAASKTADAITTQQLLNRGGRENSVSYGSHPSPGRLAGVNVAWFAGESFFLYKTEANRRWYVRWGGRVFIGLKIVDHARLAACNSKIDPLSRRVQNCHSFIPF